jgi:hypothetical protein
VKFKWTHSHCSCCLQIISPHCLITANWHNCTAVCTLYNWWHIFQTNGLNIYRQKHMATCHYITAWEKQLFSAQLRAAVKQHALSIISLSKQCTHAYYIYIYIYIYTHTHVQVTETVLLYETTVSIETLQDEFDLWNIQLISVWWLSQLAQAVMFLAHILEVLSLNLGHDISYPETFHGFPSSLQANAGIMHQIRPWPLPSTYFPTH